MANQTKMPTGQKYARAFILKKDPFEMENSSTILSIALINCEATFIKYN